MGAATRRPNHYLHLKVFERGRGEHPVLPVAWDAFLPGLDPYLDPDRDLDLDR
ncbi:hypothetical protein ACQPZG_00550 (plasmid) [Streptomyces sp. CA-294286]|uniref:hypothetical protein n=1 Tax=Streptomyces sp. CA-294286 TaxID=3240070 RepID=UPI003D90CED3